MDVNILTEKGTKKMTVSDKIFDVPFNEGLVHQLVTSYLAGARAGTKAQKSRSDVRGGGAKPWKQKGTGRARAGTIRSPIWRKGGVTFAAKPRDFSQKVNKKVYRKGICCILAELYRNSHLIVVDEIKIDAPKTKEMLAFLAKRELGCSNVLLVSDEVHENAYLASRNLINIVVIDSQELNPYLLMKFDKVVITEKAMTQLEERLK